MTAFRMQISLNTIHDDQMGQQHAVQLAIALCRLTPWNAVFIDLGIVPLRFLRLQVIRVSLWAFISGTLMKKSLSRTVRATSRL